MRLLASALFAVAAAAVALGGAGLVVAPHRMPPGTPLVHEHPVTALRFPILVLVSAPGIPSADELAADRARHARHLAWTAADGTVLATFENAHQVALLASGLALALLVFGVPRLPRPSRRPVADLLLPAVSAPQWQLRVTPPPPRTSVFAIA
jgi:hypothetical protein